MVEPGLEVEGRIWVPGPSLVSIASCSDPPVLGSDRAQQPQEFVISTEKGFWVEGRVMAVPQYQPHVEEVRKLATSIYFRESMEKARKLAEARLQQQAAPPPDFMETDQEPLRDLMGSVSQETRAELAPVLTSPAKQEAQPAPVREQEEQPTTTVQAPAQQSAPVGATSVQQAAPAQKNMFGPSEPGTETPPRPARTRRNRKKRGSSSHSSTKKQTAVFLEGMRKMDSQTKALAEEEEPDSDVESGTPSDQPDEESMDTSTDLSVEGTVVTPKPDQGEDLSGATSASGSSEKMTPGVEVPRVEATHPTPFDGKVVVVCPGEAGPTPSTESVGAATEASDDAAEGASDEGEENPDYDGDTDECSVEPEGTGRVMEAMNSRLDELVGPAPEGEPFVVPADVELGVSPEEAAQFEDAEAEDAEAEDAEAEDAEVDDALLDEGEDHETESEDEDL